MLEFLLEFLLDDFLELLLFELFEGVDEGLGVVTETELPRNEFVTGLGAGLAAGLRLFELEFLFDEERLLELEFLFLFELEFERCCDCCSFRDCSGLKPRWAIAGAVPMKAKTPRNSESSGNRFMLSLDLVSTQ